MGPIILPTTTVTPIVQVARQRNFSLQGKTLQSHLTPMMKAHGAIVYFGQASHTLSSKAKRILNQLNVDAAYTVTGFASPVGNPVFNHTLSVERAKAVAHFLKAQGVRVCSVNGIGAWPVLPYPKAQRVTIKVKSC